MRPRLWGRSSVFYSLGVALTFIGFAAGLILFVLMSFWDYSHLSTDWYGLAFFGSCLTYNASGLLLWWFRPSNPLGPIMVGVGFVLLLLGLDTLPNQALDFVGTIFFSAPIAGLFHILMAFPSGRLLTRSSRLVVGAMWFESLVVQIPQSLYTPGGPLSIGSDPGRVHTWYEIQLWSGLGVAAVAAVILLGRIRRTTPRLRLILWPLYIYGLIAIFGITFTYNILGPRLHLSPTTVIGVQFIILALAPVFFAAAALSGAFGRTGRIDELAAVLGRTGGSEGDTERILARTLGDDSVRLLFWVEDQGTYVNASGSPVDVPHDDPERGVVEIEVLGRLVGAIVYDSELTADPEPVRAAAQVVAIAADRERLLADLKASQESVRQSRARIVEAGDRERRRIARNLHDGVQGQLVMLAIDAEALATDAGTPAPTRAAATTLRSRLDSAASELRQLVHAVMPAPLLERGLVAATEDLVDRVPIRTTLALGSLDDELPQPVQSTAYFIVAEALTNALKHARATSVHVCMEQTDGQLVVTVTDDGVGGAAPAGGSGLRGLTDRAEALGGGLTVDSSAGAGTTLTAVLPYSPALVTHA